MEKYFVVNTTDDDTNAKNAEVLLFVNTIDNDVAAKNAWVSVFMETQKLPVVDAKNPDQLDERK